MLLNQPNYQELKSDDSTSAKLYTLNNSTNAL